MQARWVRACVTVGVVLVALPHCGDSKEEKLTAAKLAASCALDSDCEAPLICAFERCHWECKEDRDCREKNDKNVGRCISSDGRGGPGVCQLADEVDCRTDADCRPGPQACASDNQCRDVCLATEPCAVVDLVCSISGYCARSQEVGPDGELTGSGAGSGGAGGGGAASSAEGGGAASSAEGGGATSVEAMGGAAATTPSAHADAGAGGSPELAGGAGLGGQAGASAITEVGEVEPNDNKNTPNPVEVGVDVLGELSSLGDHDFFALTAPDEPGGGYFEITVTDLPKGLLQERIWVDGTSIHSGTTSTSGDDYRSYVAALPGKTYIVEVAPFQGGQPYTYRLKTKYTSSTDVHEPNDIRATSTLVERNVPIEGLLFTGARADSLTRAAYDDWYAVQLDVGQVNVSLTSAPPQLSTEVYLHDSSGTQLAFDVAAAQEDPAVPYTVTKAGTYHVRVGSYVGVPLAVGTGFIPPHFTDTYVLKIQQ